LKEQSAMIFTNQQLCDNGCGRLATYTTKKGKHTCATQPAGCPTVLAKMRSTTMERHGVSNISSSKKTKLKKKKKALEKYGVDNVSKATNIRQLLSDQRSAYWNEIYKTKKFTVDGLTRKQYGARASQYAITQYNRNIDKIDPQHLRCKHWHVDHIYSVTDGFLNDVPVNVISDISNLRLISDTDNYKKHKRSDKTIEQLYEDYELASSE